MQSSLLGMLTNLVLALCKGVPGLYGHSFALVADVLESVSDVLSGFAVCLGLQIAVERPDRDHPYGHGKRFWFILSQKKNFRVSERPADEIVFRSFLGFARSAGMCDLRHANLVEC
jgi:hypothetical protein